jgi:hypothetical protein
MKSQKVRKYDSLAFIAEVRLSNITTFKKIPAFAGMTTNTFCEFVIFRYISFFTQNM